ncbi:RNA recognition motif domain-containing protein [Ditylenchus destructor]|uniref:RNA recognition motif domain-containing protein n=1 Tax=Ditylenchus destructor TaxID=166010 RepID=A0AAD4MM20_9BILA|nr:RNA recognition motif domain-containing protein [Ditylenchus destructor]
MFQKKVMAKDSVGNETMQQVNYNIRGPWNWVTLLPCWMIGLTPSQIPVWFDRSPEFISIFRLFALDFDLNPKCPDKTHQAVTQSTVMVFHGNLSSVHKHSRAHLAGLTWQDHLPLWPFSNPAYRWAWDKCPQVTITLGYDPLLILLECTRKKLGRNAQMEVSFCYLAQVWVTGECCGSEIETRKCLGRNFAFKFSVALRILPGNFGNIPYNTTEHDLGTFFSTCGAVTNVRLVYDRETRRPKGFGFCEFADAQGAQNAISQMNGADFNGRALRVNSANK